MLENLQPNILKGHTREFLSVLFISFGKGGAQQAEARSLLKALVLGPQLMKSAKAHIDEVAAFKKKKIKGTPYIGVGISKSGYEKLGIPIAKWPPDPSFRGGMKKASLLDPPVASWESHYRGEIDAVVLVGDQLPGPRNKALAKVRQLIAARHSITILGEEIGNGLHNRNGDGIEHFGYVDGRSQPLFLTEDVTDEMLTTDGATEWKPGFGPDRAIVSDPAAPDPTLHFGSYFIFRKLEQDVKRFKTEEQKLAKRLGLRCDEAERAGAMIVGRFEDGTPLTEQFADGAHNPVQNDFNYNSDPDGAKCPFFAHIRKVNPRGSGGFEKEPQERLHIMARRGQTFGVRTDDPNDGKIENKPSGDVGLLFMAFNANIAEQFEFAQSFWANSASFPKAPTPPGLDLVIGQGARPNITCPVSWGADPADTGAFKSTTPVPQTVTMKGGEYFFMPSLAFLKTL